MPQTQTFLEHLLEIRRRAFWIFASLIAFSSVGYVFRNVIVKFIQRPLGYQLYYTNPAGSFNFEMKVSIIIGFIIALPIIIYHLLRFISPALPSEITKKLMTKVMVASFALATIGVVFGYYVIVPLSLHFFSKYNTAQLKPLIAADSYLSYILNNLIIFALLFQIPIIVLFINRIKPLKPKRMLHYQRHVIVGSLALAIILPFTYDPVSQFVVAIPIVFLYYLSVLLIWLANHKKKIVPATELQPIFTPIRDYEKTPALPKNTQLNVRFKTQRSIDGIIRRQIA